jgi:hypothetical protein
VRFTEGARIWMRPPWGSAKGSAASAGKVLFAKRAAKIALGMLAGAAKVPSEEKREPPGLRHYNAYA